MESDSPHHCANAHPGHSVRYSDHDDQRIPDLRANICAYPRWPGEQHTHAELLHLADGVSIFRYGAGKRDGVCALRDACIAYVRSIPDSQEVQHMKRVLLYLALSFLAGVMLIPFLWMALAALKDPTHLMQIPP